MNRIIECRLDSTYKEIYTGIWQHDYGQILRITGVDLPKAVEVQFSLRDKGGDTLTRIGTTVDGVTEVKVPDSLLKNEYCTQNYLIYAWIYVTDDTSGNTEYQIILHVKSRPKPEKPTEEPLPEPNIFHETVEAVNAAADRAEAAEQNAKANATEAEKYAASASKSAVAAEKTKEDALRKIGEKKQKAIEAIQEQEEASVGKIINHTDNEIQRIQNQTASSKRELEHTITNAGVSKEELDESIQTAGDTKTALDKSTELAGTAKTELDASTQKAGEAKTALDGSTNTAGEMQETLSATVKQAGALDTSLGEKIETGTQLKTDLVASGEKAVQDIQNAGSEQLGKMQAVAEEFTADREQITTNKEDIGSLKEEMGKNYLDDAKTKRSLDALWKLNQGISYQFETDAEKVYQKDIPSGAKLVSVKKIGGRTVVWNQMLKLLDSSNWTARGTAGSIEIADGECIVRDCASTWGGAVIAENLKILQTHKYYISLYGRVLNNEDSITIAVAETFPVTEIGVINSTTAYRVSKIVETSESSEAKFAFGNRKNTYDYAVSNFMLIDLTKMFGAGNEPSTPEEFEAMFPADYYPYNEGALMSAPVNEVVEQGKNYFDFSKLVSDGVNVMDYEKQTITVPAKTNNTGYNQTLRDLCPGITPGTYVFSIKRSNPESGNGSYFLESGKDFSTNTPIEITDVLLDNHISWYNNPDSEVENVISEIQIEKNSVKTSYSQYYQKSHKIPQAILNLDGYGESGNFVDFVEKKYHKGDRTIDISDIMGDTFQEPFEVEAGGTLTFHNSNGDGYRLPVPNEEEYIVSLAEVGGGASE